MTSLRRLRESLQGTAVILAYHRLSAPRTDPQRLGLQSDRFEEHMRLLGERYTPITLNRLVDALARGDRLPDRAVVVTVDDGYADTLHVGQHILARYDVPATIFVSSGHLGSTRGFWWDEIENLILGPGELPGELALTGHASITVAASAVLEPDEAQSLAGWNVTQPPTHPRQELYLHLMRALASMTADERSSALCELRSQARPAQSVAEANLVLTKSELLELDSSELIEIGGHTYRHVTLSREEADTQRDEIVRDRQELENLLGHAVSMFAYPHGRRADYTHESSSLVREAGYLGAVTTRLGGLLPWGSVGWGTDRYQMPRTVPPDLDAKGLSTLLDKRLGL